MKMENYKLIVIMGAFLFFGIVFGYIIGKYDKYKKGD